MKTALEHFESAFQWLNKGQKEKALHQLQACLLIDPNHAMAWANRGNILYEMDHAFEALVSLDRALIDLPKAPELHVDRCSALMDLGRFDDALASANKALELRPGYDLALGNKALLMFMQGKFQESADLYGQALQGNYIDVNEAHMCRGMNFIAMGRLKEGWAEYEFRDRKTYIRHTTHKTWQGESLEGKSILVYSEQGYGDAFHFMRFAPILKAKHNCTVYLEVRRPIVRIAQTMNGINGVYAFGDDLPKCDYAVSMMSLPYFLNIDTVADIPGKPYLSAKGEREKLWLFDLPKMYPRIGLCWTGDSRPENRTATAIDRRRSMSLMEMAPLGRIPDMTYISLQMGKAADQIFNPPEGLNVSDWRKGIDDFYDTAALIECLDLVITVDTAVAHVAGALGKPVWLLSRYDSCWRWMGHREDSPWYPTMRLFHQTTMGDWNGVMERVADALRQLVTQAKLRAA
jgi:tetratricopeptide (TPR) repeat protein